MIGKRITFRDYVDERGMLRTINHLPFKAQRVFFISNVARDTVRGNHFSKTSDFLYIVVTGGCKVELDNGYVIEKISLNAGEGLYFEKTTWMKICDFEKDTILCVMANMDYNAADYSSDYKEFQRIVRGDNV